MCLLGWEWGHVDAGGYKGTPDSQHRSGPRPPPRVRRALVREGVLVAEGQGSPVCLAPRMGFIEDNFFHRPGQGWEDCFLMIQARDIYCGLYFYHYYMSSSSDHQASDPRRCSDSVIQSCPTLCNPMDCSMTGFPILYYCPEFTQTHGN